jgi:hypothetical protein
MKIRLHVHVCCRSAHNSQPVNQPGHPTTNEQERKVVSISWAVTQS